MEKIVIVGRANCSLKFYRNLKSKNYDVKIFDFVDENDNFNDAIVISYSDIIPPLCKKYIYVKCGCSINIDENFGIPELEIKDEDKKRKIFVKKTCICGATFDIVEEANNKEILNFDLNDKNKRNEILNKFAMIVEYYCVSNDPFSIHTAGEIHYNALRKAIEEYEKIKGIS